MTPFFKEFINKLSLLNWTDLHHSHSEVEGLLEGVNSNRELFREELANHSLKKRTRLSRYSHETTTHFKWFLFREPSLGYEIWVHEYKNKTLMRPGYASVPHNHRYWFTSLVLSGGFKQTIYRIIRKDEESFTDAFKVREECYSRNTVYTVNSDVIHTLNSIEDTTITLIVRCKAVKPFSEEFDINNGRIIRHNPFSTRIKDGYPILGSF